MKPFQLAKPSIHPRTCEQGREMGVTMSQIAAQEATELIINGDWTTDERCASCAFRLGTVPNGCIQTQLDVLKAVLEHAPFFCHVVAPGAEREVCGGWFATMQASKRHNHRPSHCDWPFSATDT